LEVEICNICINLLALIISAKSDTKPDRMIAGWVSYRKAPGLQIRLVKLEGDLLLEVS